jgi:hypothetical protein
MKEEEAAKIKNEKIHLLIHDDNGEDVVSELCHRTSLSCHPPRALCEFMGVWQSEKLFFILLSSP